ncbi:MAG: DUF4304 domain-containing protein [Kofleriaceae bacterium]|nr:DUF4304 domain-containing protein [Kofleriaceae bacterium]
MTLDAVFRSALRERVQPFLKQSGFSKKHSTFMRMKPEVVHLVSVQKGRKSTAGEISIAVNLGVASVRLLRRSERDPLATTIEECQWRRRLTGESKEEPWWTLRDLRSAQTVSDEVAAALRVCGLPILDELSTDAALRDLWLSGQSPGLTDVQRLLNLSVILREIGPIDEAKNVLQSLKKTAESTALPVVLNYLQEVGEV